MKRAGAMIEEEIGANEKGGTAMDNSSNGRAANNMAKKRKKNNKTHVPLESYEVERIVKHVGSKYYVKWEGYPEETNTWEPLENLRGCLQTVGDYFHNLIYPGMDKNHYSSKVAAIKMFLSDYDNFEIQNYCRTYFTDNGENLPHVDEEELENDIMALAQIPSSGLDNKIINELKLNFLYKEIKVRRAKQLKDLKQWELDIRAVCSDSAMITVVNSVDLEGPPHNFNYVNSYIAGPDVVIPEEPPMGCSCKICPEKNCCSAQCAKVLYNDGILKVPRGTPIYECNKACKCGVNCPNRVMQTGRTIPVSIFRTNNGCGWGLRTLSKIKKGQFVAEYVGEVITGEEAERRGRFYDKRGCTYLFDLDFNDKENVLYTVDAASYGNVSHFINHSCNPNLDVYAVWVNCLDPNLPRLGLFAARGIKENEELTFDYLCQPVKDTRSIMVDISKKINTSKNKNNSKHLNGNSSKGNIDPKFDKEEYMCKCGSSNCRKYLFFY